VGNVTSRWPRGAADSAESCASTSPRISGMITHVDRDGPRARCASSTPPAPNANIVIFARADTAWRSGTWIAEQA